MVLLKNDGVLPLRRCGPIAVIGRAARTPAFQGGGSSQITPTRIDIPLDELGDCGRVEITLRRGLRRTTGSAPGSHRGGGEAARADAAVIFVAAALLRRPRAATEPVSTSAAQQVALIDASRPRSRGRLWSCSADLLWRCRVVDRRDRGGPRGVAAGQAAGGAIADVLFGVVNPLRTSAETFPVRMEDTPAYLNFPGDGDEVRYGEGMLHRLSLV